MKKQIFLFIFIALIFITCYFSFFDSYPKEVFVEKVIDGDTFEGEGKIIRLLGVDAPEKAQPCYEEAKIFLENLIRGKKVKLEYDNEKRDKYGRILAYVWIDNIFVNKEMIENGYAVFRNYGKKLKYEKLLALPSTGCVAGIDTCEECIGVAYFLWNPEGDDCKGDEFVKLKNFCDFSCNLTGWKIKDKEGNEFVLQNVSIEKVLYIYSGCGSDTKNKIFLCPKSFCKAIWNNEGDSFILLNEKEEIVLNYTYG